MKFSILIPTLNEEKYIGNLLDCLVAQSFNDFEVIVVDGISVDNTKDKVLSYKKDLNISFIESEKRGVSFQRNLAAKSSNSENLIFFDADITIPYDFLEKINSHINKENVDVMTSWIEPLSDKKTDEIIFRIYDVVLDAVCRLKPGGGGAFIYVKKPVFNKLGGFDEGIELAEDFDFFDRTGKHGYKYKLLRKPKIKVSVRRLNKDGRLYFYMKTLRNAFVYYTKGPIKDANKFKYYFGDYAEVKKKKKVWDLLNK